MAERKRQPTRTTRLHVETADKIERIARALGLTAAEYVDSIALPSINRDLARARKIEAQQQATKKQLERPPVDDTPPESPD